MSRTAAQKVIAAERRQQAMELRRTGASFAQIGQTLGISAQAAHKAVRTGMAALAELTEDDARELRALELDRLDRAQVAIWRQVTQGNLGAIDRLLRIMERRAKLTGLDAPTKHASTTADGEEDRPFGYLALPPACTDVNEWLAQHAPHVSQG